MKEIKRIWKSYAANSSFGSPLITAAGLQIYLLSEGCHTTRCLPHCDQAQDSIQQILVHCIFARQVWSSDLSEAGFDFHLITAHRQPFLKLVVLCNQVGAKGNQKMAQLPYYSSDLGMERQECLYFHSRVILVLQTAATGKLVKMA